MAELALICSHGGITFTYGREPLLAIFDGLVVVLLTGYDIKVHGMTVCSSHIRIVYVNFHKSRNLIGLFRVIFRLHIQGIYGVRFPLLIYDLNIHKILKN